MLTPGKTRVQGLAFASFLVIFSCFVSKSVSIPSECLTQTRSDLNSKRWYFLCLLQGPGDSGQLMRVIPDWSEGDLDEYTRMIYTMGSLPSRRNLLPLKLRVDLIQQSSHMSQRQLAAAFGISKTQVFAILKKKEEILQMYEKTKAKEAQDTDKLPSWLIRQLSKMNFNSGQI